MHLPQVGRVPWLGPRLGLEVQSGIVQQPGRQKLVQDESRGRLARRLTEEEELRPEGSAQAIQPAITLCGEATVGGKRTLRWVVSQFERTLAKAQDHADRCIDPSHPCIGDLAPVSVQDELLVEHPDMVN